MVDVNVEMPISLNLNIQSNATGIVFPTAHTKTWLAFSIKEMIFLNCSVSILRIVDVNSEILLERIVSKDPEISLVEIVFDFCSISFTQSLAKFTFK